MADVLFECFEVTEPVTKANGVRRKWEKIGCIFAHKDGQGGLQMLERIPRGGRIVCRTPRYQQAALAPSVKETLSPLPSMSQGTGGRYSILDVEIENN